MEGTFYCTKCGTSNAADANYCFKCGQPVTKAQATDGLTEGFSQTDQSPPGPENFQGNDPVFQGATAKQSREPRSYNFIAKHWRGGYSLGIAYWLFGFLLAAFLGLLSVTFVALSDSLHLRTQQQGTLLLAFCAFYLAASIWQLVGVMRSASAHVSRGGKRFWAVTAQVMVCLGALRLLSGFFINDLPLIREGIDMVSGTDKVPPYSLRLMRNNTELEVSGGIPIGTTDAVRNILDTSPTVRVIYLNSAGGRVAEADKLASLIADRKLITYTRTSCASACALAFLAGRERYIGEQGQIGFHSASVNGARVSDDLNVNASFKKALTRVGATSQFILKATSTSPSDMWFPTVDELTQQNIITSVVDSRYYGLSGVSDWRDANSIEKSLLLSPVYAALSTYDASNYAKLRKTVVDGVQAGRSMAEVQSDIHVLISTSIVPSYLNRAPDQALIRYWRSQVEEMKYLGRTNADQCVAFIGLNNKIPTPDLMSKVPKDLTNEDLAALTDVIKQTAANPMKAQPFSTYTKEFQGILLAMMKKDRRSVEVISAPEKFSHDPAIACASTIMLYDAILSMNDAKKAAGLLRSMAQESMR
ncbi:zinc-ribbon domain-containing protein [Pseudomonas sp. NPDC089569]|uniref:zinc-ribbon domain-containing protein n=1 Tax=Pseudomonas sp. NPDC089569 TaxID=3390722 RepID=UPI003CFBD17C